MNVDIFCAAHISRHGNLVRMTTPAVPNPTSPSQLFGMPTMIKNFDDFQKLGQQNVDTAMKLFGEWNKGWQAIAAEFSDYTLSLIHI